MDVPPAGEGGSATKENSDLTGDATDAPVNPSMGQWTLYEFIREALPP